MLMALTAMPMALSAAEEAPVENVEKALLGTWFVTAGQVSIIFSLEPGGQALVVFDEGGAMTIGRHFWRALPGGVLIETLPRFRMWRPTAASASTSCEVQVEMERLPADAEISSSLKQFPPKFCMKRVTHAPLPRRLATRALPSGWEKEEPQDPGR